MISSRYYSHPTLTIFSLNPAPRQSAIFWGLGFGPFTQELFGTGASYSPGIDVAERPDTKVEISLNLRWLS
jgi:hypothetical protein